MGNRDYAVASVAEPVRTLKSSLPRDPATRVGLRSYEDRGAALLKHCKYSSEQAFRELGI